MVEVNKQHDVCDEIAFSDDHLLERLFSPSIGLKNESLNSVKFFKGAKIKKEAGSDGSVLRVILKDGSATEANIGSLPIYSAKVAMSVVDSVPLVHQVDAKVAILYDLFGESKGPISAPLPLVLRGPRANISSFSPNDNNGSSKLELTNDQDVTLYSDGGRFLIPDLICDSGLLWKIHLDLDAISASSSDVPAVLEFLQRRQMEAKKIASPDDHLLARLFSPSLGLKSEGLNGVKFLKGAKIKNLEAGSYGNVVCVILEDGSIEANTDDSDEHNGEGQEDEGDEKGEEDDERESEELEDSAESGSEEREMSAEDDEDQLEGEDDTGSSNEDEGPVAIRKYEDDFDDEGELVGYVLIHDCPNWINFAHRIHYIWQEVTPDGEDSENINPDTCWPGCRVSYWADEWELFWMDGPLYEVRGSLNLVKLLPDDETQEEEEEEEVEVVLENGH